MFIRDYKSTDYRVLSQLILSLYIEDPEGESMDQRKIDKTVQTLTNNPHKGLIHIIESSNEVVGYCILTFQWSNEYGCDIVHIDELYIIPEMRGRGIGTEYIKSIMNIYSNNVVALEVTPSNKRVKQYYVKLGFREVGNCHLMFKKN